MHDMVFAFYMTRLQQQGTQAWCTQAVHGTDVQPRSQPTMHANKETTSLLPALFNCSRTACIGWAHSTQCETL